MARNFVSCLFCKPIGPIKLIRKFFTNTDLKKKLFF